LSKVILPVYLQSGAVPTTAAPRQAGPDFPLTKLIIGLNVAVFLLMVLNHVSPVTPQNDQLIRWGADYGPLTFGGQWWRVLSSVFVHIGIVHLALNMWCLWNLGALAEHIYGRWLYLFIYLFSGIGGSLASLWWHPTVTGAGASGAIFGLAGALIITLRWGDLAVPQETLRPILRSLTAFAGYNLFFGAVQPGIDNAAHLGGLAVGVIQGAVIIQPAFRRPGSEKVRTYCAVALSVALMGVAMLVARVNGWVTHLERAQIAVQKNDHNQAIVELKLVAASRPNEAAIQYLLAKEYIATKQYAPAQARLLRAVELDPKSADIWTALGFLYLQTQRGDQSVDAFNHAAALAPNSPQAHLDLGLALAATARLKDAIPEFKRAAELNPNADTAYFDLGEAYLQVKDFDNAIKAFQEAVRLQPNNAQSLSGLAIAYRAKGMVKEADAVQQKILQLKSAQQQQSTKPQ
jgi:membrane associated rhomboid family serine protease/Tfp pilus assembly protein PilF